MDVIWHSIHPTIPGQEYLRQHGTGAVLACDINTPWTGLPSKTDETDTVKQCPECLAIWAG